MILNPKEIAEAENQLIKGGLNPEPLMDEAGLGIAQAISQFFPNPGTLIVFVGNGHNGGDALVAAKHLKKSGWIIQLRLAASPDKLKPLTAKKLQQFTATSGGRASMPRLKWRQPTNASTANPQRHPPIEGNPI